MSRPPADVQVDGERIKIRVRSRGRFKDGYSVAGEYNAADKAVYVAPGRTLDFERKVVFEELGHWAWHKAELKRFLLSRDQELVVHDLLPWMFEVLHQNSELRAYLFEEE